MKELLQSLVDKDDADECGEGLLCEPGDVADQRASICGHQNHTQEGCPQTNAGPQRQVGQAIVAGTQDMTEDGRRHPLTFIKLLSTISNLIIS